MKKASELFGDVILNDLPSEKECELDYKVEVSKSALLLLYNFAFELAKKDAEKIIELKEIDLLLNR